MDLLNDTIAAIATAPGEGAIAVVRVGGAAALAVADRVFRGGPPLSESAGMTLHHGWLHWPGHDGHEMSGATTSPSSRRADATHEMSCVDDGGTTTAVESIPQPAMESSIHDMSRGDVPPRLDEVVAAVFRAPRSYTREDVVEFSCHGGRLSAERVLAALLAAGARIASPGEFTLRAFVHGRIDLAQAEAVADVIAAETETARMLALSQLRGELSARIGGLEDAIADAAAEVEARVDFAEDVGGVEVPDHVVQAIARVRAEVEALRDGAAWGRAVREGLRVALVGRPNAGKSSLFNALLGEARAIVTRVPGTTRDLVSEPLELDGVRLTLIDTAGLRDGGDDVERIGIARARAALAESALVLWVVDTTLAPDEAARALGESLRGRRAVVALNQIDRSESSPAAHRTLAEACGLAAVEVSALRGDGLDALRAALSAATGAGRAGAGGGLGNRRHVEAMERAAGSLARAHAAAGDGLPGEIVALELREALAAIGEVTGRGVAPDLIERIFARFCIGK